MRTTHRTDKRIVPAVQLAKKIFRFPIICFILLTALFLFLRLYRFSDRTLFQGDQGLDMLVIWTLIHKGAHPAAGPPLSIAAIPISPAYYYLMGIFYRITMSVTGVYAGMFMFAAVSAIYLVLTGLTLGGMVTGLVTGAIIAIADMYIFQALTIWDSVVPTAFVSAGVYYLVRAFRKRSTISLILTACIFAVSLTLYPSSVILLPALLFSVWWWYRSDGKTRVRALFFMIGTVATPMVCIFFAALISGFNPAAMTRTIASYVGIALENWRVSALLFAKYLTFTLSSLTPLPDTLPYGVRFLGETVILLPLLLVMACSVPKKLRRRFAALATAVSLGIGIIVIYRGEIDAHRIWPAAAVLTPFLAYALVRSFRAGRIVRYAALWYLTAFLLTNLSVLAIHWVHAPGELATSRHTAEIIASETKRRGLSWKDVQITYYFEGHNEAYQASPILYWLTEYNGYPVQLNTLNNYIDDPRLFRHSAGVTYLICDGYTQTESVRHCLTPVSEVYGYTVSHAIPITPSYHLYILTPAKNGR